MPRMRFSFRDKIDFSGKPINQSEKHTQLQKYSVFEYCGFLSMPDKKYLSAGMNILMEYQREG